MRKTVTAYIQLTKPTIILLVLFTGSTSLVLEGSLLTEPVKFLLVLIGLYLTGGCANALNQYFERYIDARMSRTSSRRPLPMGIISARSALVFSISIGVLGVLLFGIVFNWLTAILSLGTILFYSLFYTLWLKPNTDQNIVIGGIAGAMAPVGAWAAATGTLDFIPWVLFLIIFFWTPPHFWALALFCKDDYKKVGLPMMPVVKGEKATLKQIVFYSLILFAVSLLLLFFEAGWFYAITALFLGGLFVIKSFKAYNLRTDRILRAFFGYSIIYLFGLFAAIILDSFIS